MHITVRLYASLRRFRPDVAAGQGLTLEIPAGQTVAGVLQQLALPDAVPVVAMVNQRVEKLDHVLNDGDTVSVFPPVAGGC